MTADADKPIEDKPAEPAEPAPIPDIDDTGNPAEAIEEKGEPFDGNLA